jgi:hypothetical protein
MIFLRIFLLITLPLISANGQTEGQNHHQKVLRKGIIGNTFVFGKYTEKGGTETHLTYLGQVKTKHGETFKILNSVWIWGYSRRATSRILIFNQKDQYVGNYLLTMTHDLPTELRQGKLIFRNTPEECDQNLITVINLKNGLPNQFFRKCKNKSGDIYHFSSE